MSTVDKRSYFMPVTTWEEVEMYSKAGLLWAAAEPDEALVPDGDCAHTFGEGCWRQDVQTGWKFAVLIEDE